MLTSSFTGVRVASKQTQSSKKINTEISARRTKASAPAKKSALKVRERRRERWTTMARRIFSEHARGTTRLVSLARARASERGRDARWDDDASMRRHGARGDVDSRAHRGEELARRGRYELG